MACSDATEESDNLMDKNLPSNNSNEVPISQRHMLSEHSKQFLDSGKRISTFQHTSKDPKMSAKDTSLMKSFQNPSSKDETTWENSESSSKTSGIELICLSDSDDGPKESSLESGGTGKKRKRLSTEEMKTPCEADSAMVPNMRWKTGDSVKVKEGSIWYDAKIVSTNPRTNTVRLHYLKWSSRYDFWLNSDSDRITLCDSEKPTRKKRYRQYSPGQNVVAKWKNGFFYEAIIDKCLGDDMYIIMYVADSKKYENHASDIKVSTFTEAAPASEVKKIRIEDDHKKFKCDYADCVKSFRKESLLISHVKHYHNSKGNEPAQRKYMLKPNEDVAKLNGNGTIQESSAEVINDSSKNNTLSSSLKTGPHEESKNEVDSAKPEVELMSELNKDNVEVQRNASSKESSSNTVNNIQIQPNLNSKLHPEDNDVCKSLNRNSFLKAPNSGPDIADYYILKDDLCDREKLPAFINPEPHSAEVFEARRNRLLNGQNLPAAYNVIKRLVEKSCEDAEAIEKSKVATKRKCDHVCRENDTKQEQKKVLVDYVSEKVENTQVKLDTRLGSSSPQLAEKLPASQELKDSKTIIDSSTIKLLTSSLASRQKSNSDRDFCKPQIGFVFKSQESNAELIDDVKAKESTAEVVNNNKIPTNLNSEPMELNLDKVNINLNNHTGLKKKPNKEPDDVDGYTVDKAIAKLEGAAQRESSHVCHENDVDQKNQVLVADVNQGGENIEANAKQTTEASCKKSGTVVDSLKNLTPPSSLNSRPVEKSGNNKATDELQVEIKQSVAEALFKKSDTIVDSMKIVTPSSILKERPQEKSKKNEVSDKPQVEIKQSIVDVSCKNCDTVVGSLKTATPFSSLITRPQGKSKSNELSDKPEVEIKQSVPKVSCNKSDTVVDSLKIVTPSSSLNAMPQNEASGGPKVQLKPSVDDKSYRPRTSKRKLVIPSKYADSEVYFQLKVKRNNCKSNKTSTLKQSEDDLKDSKTETELSNETLILQTRLNARPVEKRRNNAASGELQVEIKPSVAEASCKKPDTVVDSLNTLTPSSSLNAGTVEKSINKESSVNFNLTVEKSRNKEASAKLQEGIKQSVVDVSCNNSDNVVDSSKVINKSSSLNAGTVEKSRNNENSDELQVEIKQSVPEVPCKKSDSVVLDSLKRVTPSSSLNAMPQQKPSQHDISIGPQVRLKPLVVDESYRPRTSKRKLVIPSKYADSEVYVQLRVKRNNCESTETSTLKQSEDSINDCKTEIKLNNETPIVQVDKVSDAICKNENRIKKVPHVQKATMKQNEVDLKESKTEVELSQETPTVQVRQASGVMQKNENCVKKEPNINKSTLKQSEDDFKDCKAKIESSKGSLILQVRQVSGAKSKNGNCVEKVPYAKKSTLKQSEANLKSCNNGIELSTETFIVQSKQVSGAIHKNENYVKKVPKIKKSTLKQREVGLKDCKAEVELVDLTSDVQLKGQVSGAKSKNKGCVSDKSDTLLIDIEPSNKTPMVQVKGVKVYDAKNKNSIKKVPHVKKNLEDDVFIERIVQPVITDTNKSKSSTLPVNKKVLNTKLKKIEKAQISEGKGKVTVAEGSKISIVTTSAVKMKTTKIMSMSMIYKDSTELETSLPKKHLTTVSDVATDVNRSTLQPSATKSTSKDKPSTSLQLKNNIYAIDSIRHTKSPGEMLENKQSDHNQSSNYVQSETVNIRTLRDKRKIKKPARLKMGELEHQNNRIKESILMDLALIRKGISEFEALKNCAPETLDSKTCENSKTSVNLDPETSKDSSSETSKNSDLESSGASDSESSDDLDSEADDKIVCICNRAEEVGKMVQCDDCQTWQHCKCFKLKLSQLNKQYICWRCKT
ncbi:hypothetical protein JTE90_018350 [Oedothorax gibbosus]|uniref:Uncharacterized protein n=1 Tax=Oedothorax gibbosus TaxID=931172 RepID=A0AAV6U1B1_9ARAC|nr:hypothetical protein JTE90_018350 [Oedothorax gibbosus]